jgi:hypothetical protein
MKYKNKLSEELVDIFEIDETTDVEAINTFITGFNENYDNVIDTYVLKDKSTALGVRTNSSAEDRGLDYLGSGKSILARDSFGKYHAWNKHRFEFAHKKVAV